MGRPRIFVEEEVSTESLIDLAGSDSHYLLNVLRLGENDELEIVSKLNSEVFLARLENVQNSAQVKIIAKLQKINSLSYAHTLIFALAKADKNDFVCEKATELGVQRIIIWQSEHSVARLSGEEAKSKKLPRWQKIVEAASKQCKRDSLPLVQYAENLIHLKKLFPAPDDDCYLKLICAFNEHAVSLNSLYSPNSPKKEAIIAIGPEGDFSKAELTQFLEQQFIPVSLGPLVLRTETAALSAISMVNGICGFRKIAT